MALKVHLTIHGGIVEMIMRYALGIIYLWFGTLKLIDNSPAEILLIELASKYTIFQPLINLLGPVECVLGCGLLFGIWLRIIIPAVTLHLIATFLPMILLVETSFSGFAAPTLIGQYMIKNLVLLAACWELWQHTKKRLPQM